MEEKKDLSEQESLLIRKIVQNAYPGPSDGLKETVMGRIRTERAVRRRKTAALVRWGSVAAAVLIIAGLGFRFIRPGVKNSTVAKDSTESMTTYGFAYTDREIPEEADEPYCEDNGSYSFDSAMSAADGECEETVSPAREMMAASALNSVGLEIIPDSFATAVIDVDGDGLSELVALSDIDGDNFRMTAERDGKVLYEGTAPYNGEKYSFEHVDGKMILRAYDPATAETGYYWIGISVLDYSLNLVPYDMTWDTKAVH